MKFLKRMISTLLVVVAGTIALLMAATIIFTFLNAISGSDIIREEARIGVYSEK